MPIAYYIKEPFNTLQYQGLLTYGNFRHYTEKVIVIDDISDTVYFTSKERGYLVDIRHKRNFIYNPKRFFEIE